MWSQTPPKPRPPARSSIYPGENPAPIMTGILSLSEYARVGIITSGLATDNSYLPAYHCYTLPSHHAWNLGDLWFLIQSCWWPNLMHMPMESCHAPTSVSSPCISFCVCICACDLCIMLQFTLCACMNVCLQSPSNQRFIIKLLAMRWVQYTDSWYPTSISPSF